LVATDPVYKRGRPEEENSLGGQALLRCLAAF